MTGSQAAGDFLKMFPYPLLQGSPAEVLKQPYFVLTESTAKALFGDQDPMNKRVRFDNKNDLTVTGILKDIPANSTFQFNFLVPFSYYEANNEYVKNARHANFEWNGFRTFVKLKPGISFAQVSAKIKNIEKVDKDNIMSSQTNVLLQPMQNWHLLGRYENGRGSRWFRRICSDVQCDWSAGTDHRGDQLCEPRYGTFWKKSPGSGCAESNWLAKKDLVIQFLTESLLLVIIAGVFALFFVQLALPAFNTLTSGKINIPYASPFFWLIFISSILITALAAGSRPAFYLSSFNPVKVLKGTIRGGKSPVCPARSWSCCSSVAPLPGSSAHLSFISRFNLERTGRPVST